MLLFFSLVQCTFQADVVDNSLYKVIKINAPNASNKGIKQLLNYSADPLPATDDVIKKASKSIAFTKKLHDDGFEKLEPFLECMERDNPGLLPTAA